MAAILTRSGELVTEFFSFPIQKVEEDANGDVMVWGKATDGSLDSDEQIIDSGFAAKAVQDWLADGANIRVQHNAQRDPAGIGVEASTDSAGATWVKGKIIEPIAKKLVLGGALRAYSVGIARPTIVRDAHARGGRITDGQVVEISLVDRPANKNCSIQLVKSDKHGHPKKSGKLTGDRNFIEKMAGTSLMKGAGVTALMEETVRLDLPADVSVAFTPADLAKVLAMKAKSPNVGEDTTPGGVDRDSMPDEDFAGKNRSFPIHSPGDVADAAQSIGRAGDGNHDPDTLKANIKAIAKRKGHEYEAQLPDSWKAQAGTVNKDDAGSAQEARDYLITKYSWSPGQVDALTSNALLTLFAATKEAEARLEKSEQCTLCHGSGKIREGNMTCPRCHGDGKIAPSEPDEHDGTDDDDDDDSEKSSKPKLKKSKKRQAAASDDDSDDDDSDDDDDDDDSDDDSDDSGDSDDGSDDGSEASKSARAPKVKKDWSAWDAQRGQGGVSGKPATTAPPAKTPTAHPPVATAQQARSETVHIAQQALQDQHDGKKLSPLQSAAIAAAHSMHEEHEAHEAHEAHVASDGHEAHEAHLAHEAHENHLAYESSHPASVPSGSHQMTAASNRRVIETVSGNKPQAGVSKGRGKRMCVKCSGMMKAKNAFCPNCGAAAGSSEPEKTGVKKQAVAEKLVSVSTPVDSPSPGDGVKGIHTEPMAQHREPDGAMTEAYENDSGMQEGDQDSAPAQPTKLEQPMLKADAAVRTLERLARSGVPQRLGIVHDLTCSAYHPASVAKCYPDRSLAYEVDVDEFQAKSFAMAASLPYHLASKGTLLGAYASVLKGADESVLQEARDELHKAFSDANPGPGTAPTPSSDIMPGSYNRAYISGGHAAPSPAQGPPNSTPITSGQITAAQFSRGPLIAGQEAPSPANGPMSQAMTDAIAGVAQANDMMAAMRATSGSTVPGSVPMPVMPSGLTMGLGGNPQVTAIKGRTFYSHASKDQVKAAMQGIHDHIASVFPNICPVKHDDDDGDGDAPAASKSAEPAAVPRQLVKSAAAEAATAAIDTGVSLKELKRQRKIQRIEKRLTEEAAFALAAMPQQPEVTKSETLAAPDMSALEAAIQKLSEQITARDELLTRQQKILKKQQKVIDELAAQPDPAVNAYRGGMLSVPAFVQKAADTGTAAPSMDDIKNQTRAMMLTELEHDYRTAAHPAQREAALKSIFSLRGVSS